MAYCIHCGKELPDGAKFCAYCGKSVASASVNNENERKVVYDGEIHKCPSCGAALPPFTAVCPSCGHEVRGVKTAQAVREFESRLAYIESKQMPAVQEKKSVMKMVFGKDFNDKDTVQEAKNSFEEQKQKEKVNLIVNFTVPNSKEDILEFMILAASNLDAKKGVKDEVNKAWLTKLNQVYKKAQLSFQNDPGFLQIQEIYYQIKRKVLKKKLKTFGLIIGFVALWFFFLGIMGNSMALIALAIVIVVIAVVISILVMQIGAAHRLP